MKMQTEMEYANGIVLENGQAARSSAPKAAIKAASGRAEGAEATHKGTQPATWLAR